MQNNEIYRIAIIGAGFGGISAARIFKEFGYDVTVFDKDENIGGVWAASRRYPGLCTQNPRDTYYLSEMKMPDHFPEWPSGAQMQEYFEAYAKRFGLTQLIRTNSEVVSARQQEDDSWTLKVSDSAQGKEYQANFDYLIIASGIFSVPNIPAWKGSDKFRQAGGHILHTSEFTDKELARGRNAVIIGYGKSSCDVAVALLDTSSSVALVARQLTWKLPKKIGNVLNFKYLMLTRLGESLFKYIRLKGFERFLHGPLGLPLRNAMLNSIEWVIEKQLKFRKVGLHPEKKLETIARSTVSNATNGLYEAVADGCMKVFRDNEITGLEPAHATLASGEQIDADIIICGTGWKQQVPFLDDDIREKINDESGNFRLYKSMVPVGVKNLAFNGYNSSFFCQLNCEVGALWIMDLIKGGIKLPDADTQNAWIDERLAWMEERTNGKHSKGTNIIPFSLHHVDELLNDMRMNLGVMKRLSQWFAPINPSLYRHILPRLKKRHRSSGQDR